MMTQLKQELKIAICIDHTHSFSGTNKKMNSFRKRKFNWDDVYQSSSEDERQIIKRRVSTFSVSPIAIIEYISM